MLKKIYLLIAAICFSLLGLALYIQHMGWAGVLYSPCPLCVLQRIAYLGVLLTCLVAYFLKPLRRLFHVLAICFSLAGFGVACRHLWVLWHPTVSCGLDPLEVWINQWPFVQLLDWLFKADGLCADPLPPVFGLSVPVWSFIWLAALSAVLVATFVRQKNR